MTTKLCRSCGETKEREEFYPRGDGTNRVQAKCKTCRAAMSEYQRKWRADNPDRVKNSELKKRFGIGLSEYQTMLDFQEGVCAVCKRPPGEIGTGGKHRGALAVDHCHKTKTLRGLLCTNCNLGLGSFFDSPELLRKAAEYLEEGEKLRKSAANLANDLLSELINRT